MTDWAERLEENQGRFNPSPLGVQLKRQRAALMDYAKRIDDLTQSHKNQAERIANLERKVRKWKRRARMAEAYGKELKPFGNSPVASRSAILGEKAP